MNILFFVLNLIILNFIKQTNCVFILKNITGIEDDNIEFKLFTEYNSSHFLGMTGDSIFLISPFKAQKINIKEEKILNSTNMKYLGEELFALICLESSLITIYNINGTFNQSLKYQENKFFFLNGKCALEYEKNKFYISFLNYLNLNEEKKINITYIILKYENNRLNYEEIISTKLNLAEFNYYNIFNFKNLINEFITIITQNNENNEGKNRRLNLFDSNKLEMKNLYIISPKKNEKDFNEILNKSIEKIYIIDGFKRDNNSFIIYGLDDMNNITIIIINFNTEIKLKFFYITVEIANIDNISLFLLNSTQIYVSYFDNNDFHLILLSINDIEKEEYKIIFSISNKLYPENSRIDFSKGFLSENNILVFILKKQFEQTKYNLNMLTFGYVKCENYTGFIHNEEEINLIEENIPKTEYYNNTLSFINSNEFEFTMDNLLIELKKESNKFSSEYLSYITGFEKYNETNELNFCNFTLIRCHESCLNCTEYSENDLDRKCTGCNKDRILTSKKDCIEFPCEEKRVWYYQENEPKCSMDKSCLNSLPYFNTDTYECVNNANIFNNKNIKKCLKDEWQENLECHKYEELQNITIEGNITISFEINNSKEPIPGTSKIDLGKCEEILKNFYNISQFEPLIIKKIETLIENKPTKKLEYEVYDKNYTKLNLSICENETIKISSIVGDKDLIKFDLGKNLSQKGIDIYNSSDEYFNDYCNNIDIGIDTDIPIEDRKKDILVDISLCEDGCIFEGINYETELINCKCNKSLLNKEKEEKEEKKSNKGNTIMDKISNKINYKIVTCYKYLFDLNNLKSNPLFLFSSSVFVILNIFTILHFTKTFSLLTNKIFNSMNLPKEHSTILHKNQKLKPSPIKKKKKKIENKDYERILKDSNIHSTRINDGNSSSFRELDIFKKKKLQKKRNENMYKTKKSKKNKFLNRIINKDIIIKPKEKEEEKDYDEMYYFEASKDDERNLIHITFSNFISKIDLIEILFFPQPYNILFVTLSGYLFSLMIDFTLNSLLFSDDVLSAKYKSGNNTLNFALSELLSIISNIIGNILAYIILKMTNYSYAFELVEKEVKDNETILQIFNKYKKIIKIRLTFYFIVQFICMCLFVYYLTIFCALYKYSMFALFKNYFLGLLTSLFYTLIISIFISLLRYLSLKCGSKKVFMMSKYLNEKL